MRKLKKAASCLLAASVVLTGFGGTVFRPMNAIAGGGGAEVCNLGRRSGEGFHKCRSVSKTLRRQLLCI